MLLLLSRLDQRAATIVRLIGFGLISWTVFSDSHHPGIAGRGLVVAIAYALCAASWAAWIWRPVSRDGATLDNYVMAIAGGVLCAAASSSAASAFVFVAVVAAGIREPLDRAMRVTAGGVLALAMAVLVYDGSALGLLAYSLGFAAATLAASNARQSVMRADQAELLLAQNQRSHEEQLRTARLEESTRIAREIHDVLAHSLGALGVQIQLVRAVLTDQGDSARAVDLLDQAHRMVTGGLGETRRAVHALRGETLPLAEGLAELSADHQRRHGARVSFEVTGVPRPLPPDAGLALTRTAQEALVNTAKHAPRQPVEIRLDYTGPGTSLEVRSRLGEDGPGQGETGLATVNGGYGLAGMRERLLLLHGTLSAGPSGREWVVVAGVPQ